MNKTIFVLLSLLCIKPAQAMMTLELTKKDEVRPLYKEYCGKLTLGLCKLVMQDDIATPTTTAYKLNEHDLDDAGETLELQKIKGIKYKDQRVSADKDSFWIHKETNRIFCVRLFSAPDYDGSMGALIQYPNETKATNL